MTTMGMQDVIQQGEYIEQIDWMCEQIKELKESLDITIRRLDELFPDRINHHLRLLKLEEAHEQKTDKESEPERHARSN